MNYDATLAIDYSQHNPHPDIDELFFKRWSPRSFKKQAYLKIPWKQYLTLRAGHPLALTPSRGDSSRPAPSPLFRFSLDCFLKKISSGQKMPAC